MTYAESREIEIACKLIRLDEKRRLELTAYAKSLVSTGSLKTSDNTQRLLIGIPPKLSGLWDKRLLSASVIKDPEGQTREHEHARDLARLGGQSKIGQMAALQRQSTVDLVEKLELMASPGALPVEVGRAVVASGLASRIMARVVSAAAVLDKRPVEVVPYTLLPTRGSDWHPAAGAGIQDSGHWVYGLPQIHSQLSGCDVAWSLPPRPHLSVQGHEERAAYFAPLALLMFGCLSWVNPALGLARWINAGMPTSDRASSLIKSHWGKWAIAHALSNDSLSFWTYGSGTLLADGLTPGQADLHASAARGREFLGLTAYGRAQLNFAGALHMMTHIASQLHHETPGRPGSKIYRCGNEIILELDGYSGWWTTLRKIGESLLIERDAASIRVRILVAGFGLLGTFRHCRVSNRWHAGDEGTHLLGWTD
ncbi:hypothetical protein R5O87_02965 [Arthrobacter globiformis]|uniref:hypothetical protein n=1 Tax=Arthrobacter globiformis TaxID=1665 RepID=UPI00397A98BF